MAPTRSGMIHAIFVAPESQSQQYAVTKIDVIAHKGIIGDRNYDQHQWHGQNITLIEIENIHNFNAQYQQQIAIEDTRRNIITQGICLTALVGQEFSIGSVKLLGTEHCEPCRDLSHQLATDTISPQQVITAFTAKAGIRATILTSGEITLDMALISHGLKGDHG